MSVCTQIKCTPMHRNTYPSHSHHTLCQQPGLAWVAAWTGLHCLSTPGQSCFCSTANIVDWAACRCCLHISPSLAILQVVQLYEAFRSKSGRVYIVMVRVGCKLVPFSVFNEMHGISEGIAPATSRILKAPLCIAGIGSMWNMPAPSIWDASATLMRNNDAECPRMHVPVSCMCPCTHAPVPCMCPCRSMWTTR